MGTAFRLSCNCVTHSERVLVGRDPAGLIAIGTRRGVRRFNVWATLGAALSVWKAASPGIGEAMDRDRVGRRDLPVSRNYTESACDGVRHARRVKALWPMCGDAVWLSG